MWYIKCCQHAIPYTLTHYLTNYNINILEITSAIVCSCGPSVTTIYELKHMGWQILQKMKHERPRRAYDQQQRPGRQLCVDNNQRCPTHLEVQRNSCHQLQSYTTYTTQLNTLITIMNQINNHMMASVPKLKTKSSMVHSTQHEH